MTQSKVNLSNQDVELIITALRQYSQSCYIKSQIFPNQIVNKATLFGEQMKSDQLATRIELAKDACR